MKKLLNKFYRKSQYNHHSHPTRSPIFCLFSFSGVIHLPEIEIEYRIEYFGYIVFLLPLR